MNPLVTVLTDRADRAITPTPIIEDLTSRVFNLKFGTSLPAGFMNLTMAVLLPKYRAYEWYERFLFYGINVYEADEPVWEGRITAITIKDYGIDVECEGYWSSMTDQILFSWWNDNDMGRWRSPAAGAGSISSEISLTGAGAAEKYDYKHSANYLSIGMRRGVTYSVGDRGVFYYALPRISHLGDKRLFQPATIHSVQLIIGVGSLVANVARKIWTADHPKGTWTERKTFNEITETSIVLSLNLEADGADVEAIAMGLDTTTLATPAADDWRWVFTDVTLYAERDAWSTRKTTPKKIIGGLLSGDANIDLGEHAKQISADTIFIEESKTEIVPALFEGVTVQDIIAKVTSLGLADMVNMIENPSAEYFVGAGTGWNSLGALTPTQVTDNAPTPGAGIKAISYAITNNALVGAVLERYGYLGSYPVALGRIEVDELLSYVFSLWAKVSAGPKNFRIRIGWYTVATGGAAISTSTSTVSVSTSWLPYSIVASAPATATHAQLEFITDTAQSTFNLILDAAMFDEGSVAPTVYIDGDSEGCAWAGEAHKSPTIRPVPAITGVFGRNRLHIKRRTQMDYRWIIPLKEMGQGGLDLQRTTHDFWVRVWARYEEAFSGFTKYTDLVENKLQQATIYDQRDIILPIGEGLAGFARAAARMFLKDSKVPKQSSQITVSGYVTNSMGCKEGSWRVRAGDLMLIPDLVPLGSFSNIGNLVDPGVLDKIKTFVIKETDFNDATKELMIVPDAPPSWFELFITQLSTTPSMSAIMAPSFGVPGFGGASIPVGPIS